ncbi:serine protease inhibitor [Paenibacillus baekrokdamisoli]|uniref:Serine protease inhibitor n=1 Tax=Paenibacillus baekrokdamisoli TaxID=1712516 RepID=A0A3G9JL34_9BACL|nr:serpin family protein [Paenibacillus baekrokdamisoli]MBB3068927.1 serpin B [Paenibacillus baekrokdamisoli]BBH23749.1 serine protease inhibitor [Paenibacillus baekrokdamisoli]
MKVRMRRKSIAGIAVTAILITSMISGCGAEKKEAPRYIASDINVKQVQAYNDFALRITKPLLSESDQENVVISPLSLTFALSLALNGAKGATKDELLHMLGSDGISVETLNQGSEVLIDLLEHADPEVDVAIANAVWARKGFDLLKGYSEIVKQFYRAEISQLDFDKADAPDTINKWVEKQTKGKIDQIVNSETLHSSVMLLMNATYFNGNWKVPFEKSATHDAPFHLTDGSAITVPMMHQEASLSYKEGKQFKAVRLPYGKGKWGMIVVLPNEGVLLDTAELELLANADTWRKGFNEGEVIVELPRFKLAYKKELIDLLKALGMTQSTDSKTADFSGMIKNSAGLYVTSVIQKTFIDVNEQGTEAAAVTNIGMDSGSQPSTKKFELRVNRPFFFAIEDQTTGAILFLGSIANPAAE